MTQPTPTPRLTALPEPLDFERLYDRHGEFVRALASRLLGPTGDPDDLTQEVFLTALKKAPAEPTIASPRAWLCRITVKLAAGARRRARIRRLLRLGLFLEGVDRRTPESLASARESTRRVYTALEHLSEKKRTAFILFEVLGMDGQQCAEILGIPVQTLRTRLFHARREFLARYATLEVPSPGGGHE